MDEGWIRFDPAAGTTLLLSPVARFVLDRLDTRDQDEAALMDAIRAEEPDASPEDCHAAVSAALAALLGAQLIRARSLDRS